MTEVRVRTFVKDSIILAVSNAGVRLVNFLLLPVYTAALAPEAYGITDLTLNFAWLLVAAISLQMDWGLQAFFCDEDNDAYRCRLVSTTVAFFLVPAAVTLLAMFMARPLASVLLGDASSAPIAAMGLGLAAATLLSKPLEMATKMRRRMKALAVFNLAKAALIIALTLAAIFAFHLGAASIVFANFVAVAAVSLLFLADNRRLLSVGGVDFRLMRRLLLCSAPMVLTAVLTWLNAFSDRYVIGWVSSQADVGLYGVAARLSGVVYVFAWGVFMAYGPFASANAQDPANKPKNQIAFDLTAMFFAVVCFFGSLFSKEIIAIMTAEAYHDAYVAVPFLLYGVAFAYLALLVGYSFTIKKESKAYLLVNSLCAAANLALNLLLVPVYGYMAAAFTTLVSYLLLFTISLRISERLLPHGYDIKRLFLAMVVPGVAGGLLLWSGSLFVKGLASIIMTLYIAAVYKGRVALAYAHGTEWLLRKRGDVFNG